MSVPTKTSNCIFFVIIFNSNVNRLKPKNLLSQLSLLEHSLNNFSFEELTAVEASHLKKSFDTFRKHLEAKIFQPAGTIKIGDINDFNQESPSEEKPKKAESNSTNLLVAQVSHEIRTPLNGIIGFTDLLREDNLSEIQLERVNAIQTASYSLMEIINELLDYSKLSAGLEQFESVDFNLKSIVNDVMYLCNTLLTNSEVQLEAIVDENIPKILVGDPSKLSQVLLNILGNAIKFVENGSIKLSIRLKSRKDNIYFLDFQIEDTGIGISKENLNHIFDSFKQAENSTYLKYGGSGLGLSIVKQIIEKQNGSISVSSEFGIGTTFQFMLPFAKGNLKNLNHPLKAITVENELEIVKEMRILVFEDNLLNQRLIEQRLKSWGCITHVTDNALYGLNILETNRIDLVLMDLKMPNMSGFEVTERIRNNTRPHINQIPVIALTADFSLRDREKCKEHQINDFILKPYASGELLSKLVKNKNPIKTTMTLASKLNHPDIEVYSDATKINLSIILEECMGEMELLEELVMLYKQNALEFMGVMRVHLQTEDIKQIESAAHKIKSGLAMMQSKSLHSIVVQIQKSCMVDGDKKHLEFLFHCFVNEYSIVEQAITEQIIALKK